MKFKEIRIKIADGIAGFTICRYHTLVAGWTGLVLEQFHYLCCKLKTQIHDPTASHQYTELPALECLPLPQTAHDFFSFENNSNHVSCM